MRRQDNKQNADISRLRGAGLSLAQANRVAQNKRGGNGPLIIVAGVGMALIGAITVLGLSLTTGPDTPVQTAQAAPVVRHPAAPEIPQPLPDTLASPPAPGAFAVAEAEPLDPAEATAVRDAIIAALDSADAIDMADDTTVTREAPPLLAAQDCVADLDTLLNPLFVQFDLGAADISPKGAAMLEQISAEIIACDQAYVMIAGHADSVGDDLTNLALSWERADRTLARLVDLGVDSAAVEAIGFGARAPSSQGSDEELGIDRRVDFRVMPRREQRP